MRLMLTIAALFGIGAVLGYAQETKPAPVLNILRETIKEGRGAAHEKVESEFAATFRRANFPGRYVALATMSGGNEVWFVEPMPSFAVNEEYEKAEDKEPLKSGLAMMDSRDGELRAASRTMWAVFRPDLSYRADKFNPAKTRYVMVGTFRVRLGRDADFEAGAKTYIGAFAKANIDECTLAYQIVAGAPSDTYLFFTMMDSMKFLDGMPARGQAIMQAMGADNFAKFMRSSGDIFVSIDDTLLEVKPGMSYPPQNFIDTDAAFWKPKAVPKPAAAAPAPEKK